MGILGKLGFWKKSSTTTVTAVQPFTSPEAAEIRVASQAAAIEELEDVQAPKPEPEEPSLPPLKGPEETARIAEGSSSPRKRGKAAKISFDTELNDLDTRTPSPSESMELDGFHLEVKPAQVFAAVTKEFGQMIGSSLQSAKWDRRCQALKSIIQVLKGLDMQGMAPPGSTGAIGKGLLRPRDRPKTWRVTCQVLNHVMKDKVMPVRLAALDLFQQAFSDLSELDKAEVKMAATTLLDPLLDRVGDSNIRLHEASRRCIVFAAQRLLGLTQVLGSLRSKLQASQKGGERTKVHFGVIDTACVLSEHFSARRSEEAPRSSEDSWTAEDMAPLILAGLDDSFGPRVRNAAVALAGVVFAALGAEALQPVLEQLRPAKQALLKSKFQELEDDQQPPEDVDGEDGEARPDLDGFLICSAAAPTVGPLPGAMPGSPSSGEEECMMDGILEDAGLVFHGDGIVHEDPERELDDSWLEEELMGFGAPELEALSEHQTLLGSLLEIPDPDSEGSNSQSRRGLNGFSVEAF